MNLSAQLERFSYALFTLLCKHLKQNDEDLGFRTLKLGILACRIILLSPLYYCDLGLARPCWAQNLLESKFACTGFSGPVTQCYCHPL